MDMTPPLRRVLLIVLAAATALAGEGAASTRRYALPGHGFLELQVPASWREEVAYPPADLPPTIEFSPATGSDFSVQITPIWSAIGDPDFNRPETLRSLLGRIGERQLDQSMESGIALVDLNGPQAHGFSFTLTDRAPAPGEWKYLTQGAVGVGDLMVSFTILANRLDSDDRQAALRMIEESSQAAPARPGATPEPALQSFPVPGKNWLLTLDTLGANLKASPSYDFDEKEGVVTGQKVVGWMVEGGSDTTGIAFAIAIGMAAGGGDAKSCRDFYWKAMRGLPVGRKTDVRLYERGDAAVVEFMVPKAAGRSIGAKKALACLAREGIWMSVELTRIDTTPEDQALFDRVLKSLRITPPAD